MPYSPPEKETVIITLLLTIIGLVLLFFCILGTTRTALGKGGNIILMFDLVEILGFIGMALIAISWLYFYMGITRTGM
jgi:hypothetical protein